MPDARAAPPKPAMSAASHPQPSAPEGWIVLKFGGTSVSRRHRWDNIGRLARQRAERNGGRALVVVSALSGTTDQLSASANAGAGTDATTRVAAIERRHRDFVRCLARPVLARPASVAQRQPPHGVRGLVAHQQFGRMRRTCAQACQRDADAECDRPNRAHGRSATGCSQSASPSR